MTVKSSIRGPRPLNEILTESTALVKVREATAFERLMRAQRDRVVVFGCGSLRRRAIKRLRELGVEPLALCDNNQSLWGTEIDGVRVLSVAEAAAQFGEGAVFLVAAWNPHHWYGETAKRLCEGGARLVVSYLPLYWRFPQDLLSVYLLNDLPSRVYEAREEVLAAERLWADGLSLEIYRANIYWRALGEPDFMPPRPNENTYFPRDMFTPRSGERIIDCGAFDGDTIRQVLSWCGADLDAIWAIECDKDLFRDLESYFASLPPKIRSKIHLIRGAAGGQRAKVRFAPYNNSGPSGDSEWFDVECYPIDSLDVAAPVSLIKMDIEGAEYDALLGGRKVIERDGPILAICV